MGRIRGKDIKGVAFDVYDAYPERFNEDYENNKKNLDELNILDAKKKRNRVAGYLVRVARKRTKKV